MNEQKIASNETPETDLVKIAERGVIESAKMWAETRTNPYTIASLAGQKEDDLLAAVTLLNCREAMNSTAHLDDERGQL